MNIRKNTSGLYVCKGVEGPLSSEMYDLHIAEDIVIDKKVKEAFGEEANVAIGAQLNVSFVDHYLNDKRPEFGRAIRAWKTISGRDRTNVLAAHGNSGPDVIGTWNHHYTVNENIFPTQRWVNRHDTSYAALFIHSCNPDALSLHSKHALLFMADKTFSQVEIYGGDGVFDLFVPNKGAIDSYELEYIVQELEERAAHVKK